MYVHTDFIAKDEATAARRRFHFAMFEDTDGVTPKTGLTFAAADIKLSKNGGAEANSAGTATEVAGGDYYYEATAGEVDTAGTLKIRIVKSGYRTYRVIVKVDPPVGFLSAQAKADVNAEVVDTLNVDTYAEPGQENPPSTSTLVKKIGYLFKSWRNRTTQTATQYSLYADNATTIDQKAVVSDAAGTTEKAEVATGP